MKQRYLKTMRRKADFSTKSLEEKEAALIKRQQVKKVLKLDQVNSTNLLYFEF